MTQIKPITLLLDSKTAAAEVAFLLRGDQVEENVVIFLNVADEKELLIEVETVAKLLVKCKFCFVGESCDLSDPIVHILMQCLKGERNFQKCRLVRAKFPPTNFPVFAYINLRKANLTKAHLRGIDLTGANFSGANLEESNFDSAILNRANLSNTSLKNARLTNSTLKAVNLSGSDLSRADLRQADLEGADLEEANLQGANLKGACLNGASLAGADLTNAVIDKATFDNAYLENTILPNGKLYRRWHQPVRFVHSLLEPSINFSNLATLGCLLLYGSVANRVEASLLDVLIGLGSIFFYWVLFLVVAIIPRIISHNIYSEKKPDVYSRIILSLGILQGLNEGLWALVGNESAKKSVDLLTVLTRPEQIILLILYLGITVLIVRAVIPAIRELFS